MRCVHSCGSGLWVGKLMQPTALTVTALVGDVQEGIQFLPGGAGLDRQAEAFVPGLCGRADAQICASGASRSGHIAKSSAPDTSGK